MKKIFTLCAVVLVALAVNAAVINITSETPNSLQSALNSASTGDTIEMAAGTYSESGDYIAFTGKEVTVRAAESAEVIIQTVCPVRLKEGAKAEFINVKFDCSTIGSYDYVIVAADDTEDKRVVLTGCEFYGWAKEKAMIEATSSRRLAAITIDNCYFHNCMKSVVFVENTGSIDLSITNSTFANITTSANFSAGVIDSRATAGSVRVDHCTFYNVEAMNTDYAAIGKIKLPSGAVVSNCIFALSAPGASTNRTIRDVVTAKNCLVYNYTTDSNYGMQSNVTKVDCIKDQDPLFTDAANGDFSLAETSPAHEAGVGGTHLGDPRWWPASWQPASIVEVTSVELDKDVLSVEVDDVELLTATVSPDDATDPSVSWSSNATANATVSAGLVSGIAAGSATITATAGEKSATCAVTVTAAVVPDVDFSAPCVLMGRKAHLEGAIWKMWKDDTYKLYGDGGSNKNYGTASWTINVTRPCVVSGVLNGVEGGHLYELDLYSGDDLLGYIAHPAAKAWSSSSPLAMDSTDHSTLTFPVAGQYKLVLRNNQEWSSGKVASITLNFIEEIVPAVEMTINEPKAGEALPHKTLWPTYPEFNVIGGIVLPDGAKYQIAQYTYYNSEGNTPAEDNFLPNTTYKMIALVEPLDGYSFPLNGDGEPDFEHMVITINDQLITSGFGLGYGKFSFEYTFTTGGIEIKDVEIGVTVPQAGDAVQPTISKGDPLFDTFASLVTLPAGANYELHEFLFYKEDLDFVAENSTLAANSTYRFVVYIAPKEGYAFPLTPSGPCDVNQMNITVTHNGTEYYLVNGWGSVGVQVDFTTSEIPTGLNDIEDGEKAVKFIENGQLFIIKNGVKYNAQGAVIK